MDRDKIAAELAKPLDKKHVKPAQKFGPKGDYIESWLAEAEANRIFGWDGWSSEVVECRCVSERERTMGQQQKPGWGVSYVAKVRIVAHGVVKEGMGAGHGVDADLGLAHESAIKEAESDAEKRALKKFGWPFGLALYDKARENVSDGEAPGQQSTPSDTGAPPFQPSAAAERIRARLAKLTDAADVTQLWTDETSTLADIKGADEGLFNALKAEILKRRAELASKAPSHEPTPDQYLRTG